MTSNSSKKDPTSHCFSSILQTIICGRNLPTHPIPSDPIILTKPDKITTFSNPLNKNDPNSTQIQIQIQAQAQTRAQGPGIVARLMGLESLPENINNYESLFRSKSMNSLHFYPNFDPTRASFHRRARTSASFHEQSHRNNLLVKLDENVEHNGCLQVKKSELCRGDSKQKNERSRENVVKLKGNERRISRKNESRRKIIVNDKKRYDQGFSSGNSSISHKLRKYNVDDGGNNLREKMLIDKRKLRVINKKEKNVKVNNNNYYNVGPSSVYSKRRVDYKEDLNVELQSDAISRSPVSVLDHHHAFDSPSKEYEGQVTSNSVRKSSPKSKLQDEMLSLENVIIPKSKKNDKGPNKMGNKHKLDKSEEQVAQYFVDLLAQIYNVVEDHVKDPKWITKYERSKAHYTEELCVNFGEEMLDLLLLELLDELIE